MAEIDISVVIPAYLGERTILDCLAAVEVAIAHRRAEIIVVNSSPDATPDLVRTNFPGAIVINSPERLSAGAARNLGVSHAHGQLIFFLDQDCMVPPDWVSRYEAHLSDPEVAGAGGSVGIRNPSNWSGCAVYFLEFLNHFPMKRPPTQDLNFLVACNCVYRAEVVRAVSFPDQTLGEDVLFSNSLNTRGLHILYDPDLEVRHHNREGWFNFLRYNYKMGHASASYHALIKLWWAAPFLRFPLLAFLAPAAVLPSIGFDLLKSRWSYFARFLLLSPMCLLGNVVWATGFWHQARNSRTEARTANHQT